MRAIVVEGASTAYGMGAGDYGGWAAELHRARQGYNDHHSTHPEVVINHALPGLTLPYFNHRFDTSVKPIASAACGLLVRVLEVGINEAKIMQGRTAPLLTLARFATELAIYAHDSESLGVPVVYIGSQPVDESRTRPVPATGSIIEDDLVHEYDELIRAQAETSGMPFVDVRALFAGHDLGQVLAEDGCHPSERGHRIIHGGVQEALTPLGFAPGLSRTPY